MNAFEQESIQDEKNEPIIKTLISPLHLNNLQ